MRGTLIAFLIVSLVAETLSQSFTFNLSAFDKNGKALGQTSCNKDTQIDFQFAADSQFRSCSSNPCTITNADSSKLRFLDAYGFNSTYTLERVETTSASILPDSNRAFVFKFSNVNHTVYVEFPLTRTSYGTPDSHPHIINLDRVAEGNQLFGIKNFITGNSTQMSSFNLLNNRDFGSFYTVTRREGEMITTLLASTLLFYTSSPVPFTFGARNASSFSGTFNQLTTGDRLCYGSLVHYGLFQTHMRQNFPLWTAWVAILLFWLYNLLAEPNTLNCYDKTYENDSMTSWGIYSLFVLGNEEYFTKLSRSTILLTSFSWQACVLACIYSTVYWADLTIIIWSAVIAWVVSIPFPFFLGCVFLNRIYDTTLIKFEILRKSKEMVNKQSADALELEIDVCEERLYGLYYWFYMCCFFVFVTSWIVAVHMMVQLPRQYVHLHSLWLASLGIAFLIDNFIFEPIMSRIFGGFQFWRARGHFYQFRLGQMHKIVTE